MTTTEIRHQIEEYIDRLSPERLKVAADFLAYLAERESQEATEELLNIPGFMESFEKAKQDIAAGNSINWRSIRRDA
jgi:hypothetical protein